VAKHLSASDVVFGGWLNLDTEPQYFSCVPKSHLHDHSKLTAGFDRIPPIEIESYNKRRTKVEVKPGELIIFYQNIVHEVNSVKATHDAIRLFFSWRLTPEKTAEPLFGKEYILRMMREQGTPKLPGGEVPGMYYANHLRFHKADLERWCQDNVKPQLLGQDGLVDAKMLSLQHYHLPLYSAYTAEEMEIFF
jgi:hypothetical protein